MEAIIVIFVLLINNMKSWGLATEGICSTEYCKCFPDDKLVQQVICACNSQDDIMVITEEAYLPLTVKNISFENCFEVNIETGLTTMNDLDSINFVNIIGLQLHNNGFPSTRKLNMENISHISKFPSGFFQKRSKLHSVTLRQVSIEVIEADAIQQVTIEKEIIFDNCDIGVIHPNAINLTLVDAQFKIHSSRINLVSTNSITTRGGELKITHSHIQNIRSLGINANETKVDVDNNKFYDITATKAISAHTAAFKVTNNYFDHLNKYALMEIHLKKSKNDNFSFEFSGNTMFYLEEDALTIDFKYLDANLIKVENNVFYCNCTALLWFIKTVKGNETKTLRTRPLPWNQLPNSEIRKKYYERFTDTGLCASECIVPIQSFLREMYVDGECTNQETEPCTTAVPENQITTTDSTGTDTESYTFAPRNSSPANWMSLCYVIKTILLLLFL